REARQPGELAYRLGRDHAVDGEPSNRQEQGKEGAAVRPPNPERLAGRDHLGGPKARPRDAQQAVQDGRQGRAHRDGDDGLADTEAERDQQTAGDQRDKIRECRDPQPGHIARRSLALGRWDGLDPMGLNLEKRISGSTLLDHPSVNGTHLSLRWNYPDQVRRVGGAVHLSAFQTHPVTRVLLPVALCFPGLGGVVVAVPPHGQPSASTGRLSSLRNSSNASTTTSLTPYTLSTRSSAPWTSDSGTRSVCTSYQGTTSPAAVFQLPFSKLTGTNPCGLSGCGVMPCP